MKNEDPHGEIPEVDPEIPENAVRIYGQQDAMDDFPVLKAFQQYIDSEQAKARKRLLMLCIFFGLLMTVVIAVFVVLLLNVSSRNQSLNDRLVEYAMKERERAAAPIVVQPSQQQDNAAILAITAKMDEMQKSFDESRRQAAEADAQRKAAEEAKKAELAAENAREVARLNKLLADQQDALKKLTDEKSREEARLAAEKEKERRHQEEIEAYRRKHYPEFYEKKEPPKQPKKDEHAELMKEIDGILDDGDARTYFDEEDRPKRTTTRKPVVKPAPQKEYSIPVDIRGSSGRWSVPNE